MTVYLSLHVTCSGTLQNSILCKPLKHSYLEVAGHYPLNLRRSWETAWVLKVTDHMLQQSNSCTICHLLLTHNHPAAMETVCMRQSLKFLGSPKIHLAGSKRFSYFCWSEGVEDNKRHGKTIVLLVFVVAEVNRAQIIAWLLTFRAISKSCEFLLDCWEVTYVSL